MTALAEARNTEKYNPDVFAEVMSLPLAASTKIYRGALVALNASGYCVAGTTVAAGRIVGRAEETIDNSSGAAGDKSVKVRRGVFKFVNSASTDALTLADVDRLCYAVDDQTVARTSSMGSREVAGRVIRVDSDGVFVEVGMPTLPQDGKFDILIAAGADLSSLQYSAVKVSGAAVVVAGAGEFAIGVLQNAPANGAIAIVRVMGVTTMKCDGTGVTVGDRISCAANGLARASAAAASGLAHTNTSDAGAATDPLIAACVLGIALATAAASANTRVLLTHSGACPVTAI